MLYIIRDWPKCRKCQRRGHRENNDFGYLFYYSRLANEYNFFGVAMSRSLLHPWNRYGAPQRRGHTYF